MLQIDTFTLLAPPASKPLAAQVDTNRYRWRNQAASSRAIMETQSDTLKEILSELFALLETQETNSSAILQHSKDQGIASDENLSIYLDQAGKASNVKWRATRMRMEYLLTPI